MAETTSAFLSVVARSPCAVALLDADAVVREASRDLVRLLGGSAAQVVGARIDDFVEPAARDPLRAWLAALSDTSPPYDVALVAREGGATLVRLTGTAFSEGLARQVLLYASAEAHQADARLREAHDRIHDAFFSFDRAWRITFVNRAGEVFAGRSRESLLGKNVWEEYPESVGTELERLYRRAVETNTPVEFEVFMPAQHRWVQVRAFPSESGLSAYLRDITEQRAAQAALRASEARLRTLFEHNLTGVLLTTPGGQILAVNPAACRMLGRTEEELVRAGRAGVVDTTDPRLAVFLEERRKNGRAQATINMFRGDGTRFSADLASCLFIGEDGATYTSLSLVDVSARVRMERSMRLLADAGAALGASLDLERSLAAFQRVLAASNEDVCVIDLLEGDEVRRIPVAPRGADGPAAERFPRPRADATAGLGWVLRTGQSELVPEVDDEWRAAASEGDPARAAALPLTARSLLMAPLRTGGACVGVLTLGVRQGARRYDAHDLTVALRLADNLALAIENARNHRVAVDARRLRDEMLGIVSHDLRAPLNVVALHARVLSKQHPETRAVAAEITRATRYADLLIKDLLLAARSDDRKLALRRFPEAVGPILDEVLELGRPLAEEQSVRLDVEVAPDAPAASVDRHRVVQMLNNLVSNAIKFTPPGGSVTVASRADAASWIVTVRDTGAGISPEQLPHIFDRFWQGAHARRTDAGLGLSIVRGIAEAHDGAVRVESELGRGTTFTVTLPLGGGEPQSP